MAPTIRNLPTEVKDMITTELIRPATGNPEEILKLSLNLWLALPDFETLWFRDMLINGWTYRCELNFSNLTWGAWDTAQQIPFLLDATKTLRIALPSKNNAHTPMVDAGALPTELEGSLRSLGALEEFNFIFEEAMGSKVDKKWPITAAIAHATDFDSSLHSLSFVAPLGPLDATSLIKRHQNLAHIYIQTATYKDDPAWRGFIESSLARPAFRQLRLEMFDYTLANPEVSYLLAPPGQQLFAVCLEKRPRQISSNIRAMAKDIQDHANGERWSTREVAWSELGKPADEKYGRANIRCFVQGYKWGVDTAKPNDTTPEVALGWLQNQFRSGEGQTG
jgi:hypothetical protein